MNRRNATFVMIAVLGAALLTATALTGVAAAGESRELDFPVRGMDCGGCSAAVNYVLSRLDGIEDFRSDHTQQRAWVRYDTAKLTPQKIVDTINEKTPFQASLPE